jgi:hypothetical protein
MEWKWSIGETYEKTPRTFKNNEKNKLEESLQNKIEESAYQQSLLSENDVWNLEETNMFTKQPNKREDTYNRMAEREMIVQIGMNPFNNNANYVNDLMVQDNFLKPKMTNTDREKVIE